MPARRLDLVRRVVCAYAAVWLVVRVTYILDVSRLPDRRFEPIGVWFWLDTPLPPALVMIGWVIAVASTVATTLGRLPVVAPVVAAIAALAVITYSNCWGQVFHTENLLVVHLGVLAAAALTGTGSGDRVSGWPLQLMSIATVVTYVLAGWAKLDIGGLDWLSGEVIRSQVAYDNVRKILLGDIHSPIGGWLVGYAWLWTPIALATLVIELGAPVALLGGRWRTAWVIGAWGFHLGILAFMAILFPYQLTGVAFASMVAVERLDPLRRRVQAALPSRRSTRRDRAAGTNLRPGGQPPVIG
ncbi:MAG: hypothetical protein ACE367_02765 [Acidimicrobiales bacterium]